MATNVSLLKPLGYQCNRSCGYCKSSDGSCSYYMACDNMRIDHYQELMDRGWRRSGTTYYKPDLKHQCCPHYTIRLEAKAFRPKKEQRQAANHFNRHVLGLDYQRKLAMLCPQSRDEKRQKRDRFDLVDTIHYAEYDRLKRPISKRTKASVEPAHKFEVSLEPDAFTAEKHAVFLKYQTEIHKDPEWRWREDAFKRFLCSGLNQQILKVRGKTMKLGSYHQCYRIDGKLVAVGVLDLLPRAVSSVYLFYDPDFQQWDFGKISALREIALAVEGKYDFYYMGYYIHSCIKMRYKAKFSPSQILDPESLKWSLFDNALRTRFDQRKYVSESTNTNPDNTQGDADAKVGMVSGQDVTQPENSKGSRAAHEPKTEGTDGYDLDSDPSDADDTEIPEGSLFEHNVPGVLNKEEVEKLDLSHWKLVVRDMLVDLEDIRGWESQRIDDPNCIKGIAAELAAAIGPNLLKDSALVLF